jgi:MFS family permease
VKIEPQKETVLDRRSQPASRSSEVTLPAKHRIGPWRVLRNRNYSLLFWGQLISSAGTQMQVVAVAWQVYLLTHSALALGLIGLVQAIPRLIFSLVGGVFADVFDRRKMLIVIEIVLAMTSAVLALCTIYHVINLFIIYIVVLIVVRTIMGSKRVPYCISMSVCIAFSRNAAPVAERLNPARSAFRSSSDFTLGFTHKVTLTVCLLREEWRI